MPSLKSPKINSQLVAQPEPAASLRVSNNGFNVLISVAAVYASVYPISVVSFGKSYPTVLTKTSACKPCLFKSCFKVFSCVIKSLVIFPNSSTTR